jgi:hypothetical protein
MICAFHIYVNFSGIFLLTSPLQCVPEGLWYNRIFAAICTSVKAISRLQYYAAAGEVLLFFDYLLTLPDEVCSIESRYPHQPT